jgi:hypothetical protein
MVTDRDFAAINAYPTRSAAASHTERGGYYALRYIV